MTKMASMAINRKKMFKKFSRNVVGTNWNLPRRDDPYEYL